VIGEEVKGAGVRKRMEGKWGRGNLREREEG
jgi:hypothetical protein